MDTIEMLTWCFEQNYHADKMNAAIHCAPVRFSPLTFRLCEKLKMIWPEHADITSAMGEVNAHAGSYEEDRGR